MFILLSQQKIGTLSVDVAYSSDLDLKVIDDLIVSFSTQGNWIFKFGSSTSVMLHLPSI